MEKSKMEKPRFIGNDKVPVLAEINTLDELKSINQLTSNIIQPGQVLIVSK